MIPDELVQAATGRPPGMFLRDAEACRERLSREFGGRRILVIGAGGSIGSASVRALLPYAPSALHAVDINENSLAELIREVRSSGVPAKNFLALPVDYGSPVMERWLREQPRYDVVLLFAALKHVRSEKTVHTVLQMMDTNLLKLARLMRWLAQDRLPGRFFSVSSDKAAYPVNLMGASKRLMEHLIFSDCLVPGWTPQVSSARFANVAFSQGSLLQSFIERLEKRQPLAAPKDVRRYFISLEEAGTICLLASALAPSGHLLIPRLNPAEHLRTMESVAIAFLRHHGLEAAVHENSDEARHALATDLGGRRYPLVLTSPDTEGEKPFEEFREHEEGLVDVGLKDLAAIRPLPGSMRTLGSLLDRLTRCLNDASVPVSKDEIVTWVSEALPQFRHRSSGLSLDERP